MTPPPQATHTNWVAAISPTVIFVVLYLSLFYAFLVRKRRWRDWTKLGRASQLPPEHREPKDPELRDLQIGQQAYIDTWALMTSKRGQLYVDWSVRLREKPDNKYAAEHVVAVQRLKKGFSVTLPPGLVISQRSHMWGYYAPVVEILQTTAEESGSESNFPSKN